MRPRQVSSTQTRSGGGGGSGVLGGRAVRRAARTAQQQRQCTVAHACWQVGGVVESRCAEHDDSTLLECAV